MALMPPFMINFTLEEAAYVTVDCSSWDVVHCFEHFGGDPIEACFPFLQLVDGSFDFSKTDGIVDHHHAWFLFEEVEDGAVDRSVVVQHFIKVHTKY